MQPPCNLDTAQTDTLPCRDTLPRPTPRWHRRGGAGRSRAEPGGAGRSRAEPVTSDTMWHDVTHGILQLDMNRLHSNSKLKGHQEFMMSSCLQNAQDFEGNMNCWVEKIRETNNYGSICFPDFNETVCCMSSELFVSLEFNTLQFLCAIPRQFSQTQAEKVVGFTQFYNGSLNVGLNMFPIILQGGAGTCLCSVAKWICCSIFLN